MTDTKTDPLDHLAQQAEASLSDPPMGQGTTDLDASYQQDPPGLSNEQALGGALAAGREAFCAFTKLKSPRTTLNDDAVHQLAALWGPVLSKHGINLSQYIGDYALEFAAVVGSFTIAGAVRAGVLAELAARKAEAAPKDTTLDTVPAAHASAEQ